MYLEEELGLLVPARLRRSHALHLRPIDQVFCLGPYRKRGLILETASHLDAFSGYPCRT